MSAIYDLLRGPVTDEAGRELGRLFAEQGTRLAKQELTCAMMRRWQRKLGDLGLNGRVTKEQRLNTARLNAKTYQAKNKDKMLARLQKLKDERRAAKLARKLAKCPVVTNQATMNLDLQTPSCPSANSGAAKSRKSSKPKKGEAGYVGRKKTVQSNPNGADVQCAINLNNTNV